MMTKSSASASSNRVSNHADPFGKKYKILDKIGEGSYSEVLKCKNRETGEIYACKRLKHCYRSWSQVNDIAELVTLRKLAVHPNILQMVEIHFDPSAGRVYLVFELMELNLYELIKDRKRLLPEARVRIMMFQLIRALRHLHKHGIFHRDVKPENILLKNDLLKLGDLGSVRGLCSKPPYTEYISTRWYRSPECLLTCGYYSFKMDVWAAGCVFYEILTLRPLFPGSSELDQINKIHNILGPPPGKLLQKFSAHADIERDYSRHTSKQARLDTIKRVLIDIKSTMVEWNTSNKEGSHKSLDALLPSHITPEARDLLKHLLNYDPDGRPSSHRALQHTYFKDLREQAQKAAQNKLTVRHGMEEAVVTILQDDKKLLLDENSNPADLSVLGESLTSAQSAAKRHGDSVAEDRILERTEHETLKARSTNRTRSEDSPENIKLRHHCGNPTEMDEELYDQFNPLKLAGDGAQKPSYPYEEVYLIDNGDGPSDAKVTINLTNDKLRAFSDLASPPQIGSKDDSDLETSEVPIQNRKLHHQHQLDLVDKSTLTEESLRRINENRRIAQMRPLISSKFSKTKVSTFSERLRSRSTPPESRENVVPRAYNACKKPVRKVRSSSLTDTEDCSRNRLKRQKPGVVLPAIGKSGRKFEDAIRRHALAYATKSKDKAVVGHHESDVTRSYYSDSQKILSSRYRLPQRVDHYDQKCLNTERDKVGRFATVSNKTSSVQARGTNRETESCNFERLPWHLRRDCTIKNGLSKNVPEKIGQETQRKSTIEHTSSIIGARAKMGQWRLNNRGDHLGKIRSEKGAGSEIKKGHERCDPAFKQKVQATTNTDSVDSILQVPSCDTLQMEGRDKQHQQMQSIDSTICRRNETIGSIKKSNPATGLTMSHKQNQVMKAPAYRASEKTPNKIAYAKESPKVNYRSNSVSLQVPNHHAERISIVAVPNSYATSNSMVNKQVREILAEMRKRREMMEDKVAQDPTLYQSLRGAKLKLTSNNSHIMKSNKNLTSMVSSRTDTNYRSKWKANGATTLYGSARTNYPSSNSLTPKQVKEEAKRTTLTPDNGRPKSRYRYKSDNPKINIGYNTSQDRIFKARPYVEKYDVSKGSGNSLHGLHRTSLISSKEIPRNRHGSMVKK